MLNLFIIYVSPLGTFLSPKNDFIINKNGVSYLPCLKFSLRIWATKHFNNKDLAEWYKTSQFSQEYVDSVRHFLKTSRHKHNCLSNLFMTPMLYIMTSLYYVLGFKIYYAKIAVRFPRYL